MRITLKTEYRIGNRKVSQATWERHIRREAEKAARMLTSQLRRSLR